MEIMPQPTMSLLLTLSWTKVDLVIKREPVKNFTGSYSLIPKSFGLCRILLR